VRQDVNEDVKGMLDVRALREHNAYPLPYMKESHSNVAVVVVVVVIVAANDPTTTHVHSLDSLRHSKMGHHPSSFHSRVSPSFLLSRFVADVGASLLCVREDVSLRDETRGVGRR